MITTFINNYSTYKALQRRYLLKGIVGGFTTALMVAILTKEIVTNFSADVILLKNYLVDVPMLLIFVPLINRLIKHNPINCYRLKGVLSIGGVAMLLMVELLDLSKIWYLVDAGLMSIVALLMMPHTSYYKSCVVNKCKDFSESCGHIGLVNNVTFVILGISIVYLNVPTWAMLVMTLPLECTERYLENVCAGEVFAAQT